MLACSEIATGVISLYSGLLFLNVLIGLTSYVSTETLRHRVNEKVINNIIIAKSPSVIYFIDSKTNCCSYLTQLNLHYMMKLIN